MDLPHYLRFVLPNRSAYPLALPWHDIAPISSNSHVPHFHIWGLLAPFRRVINPMGEKTIPECPTRRLELIGDPRRVPDKLNLCVGWSNDLWNGLKS